MKREVLCFSSSLILLMFFNVSHYTEFQSELNVSRVEKRFLKMQDLKQRLHLMQILNPRSIALIF